MIPLAESIVADAVLVAFGEDATVGGESVKAEYRAPHVQALGQDGQVVTTRQPSITVKVASLSTPPTRGTDVVIRSQSYKVQEVQFDSGGMARLLLREVS